MLGDVDSATHAVPTVEIGGAVVRPVKVVGLLVTCGAVLLTLVVGCVCVVGGRTVDEEVVVLPTVCVGLVWVDPLVGAGPLPKG